MFSRHAVNSEFRDWFNVLTTTCNDGRKNNIEQVFYAAAQRWEVVYTHFFVDELSLNFSGCRKCCQTVALKRYLFALRLMIVTFNTITVIITSLLYEIPYANHKRSSPLEVV